MKLNRVQNKILSFFDIDVNPKKEKNDVEKIEKIGNEFIKNFEKNIIKNETNCKICKNNGICRVKGDSKNPFYCSFLEKIDFNPSKELILIVEDNIGIANIIEETLKTNHNEYEIIKFTGKDCAFRLLSFLENNKEILKVKCVITDLYIPSIKMSEKENVKFDGVDLISKIKENSMRKHFKLIVISSLGNIEKYSQKFERMFNENIQKYFYNKSKVINLLKLFEEKNFLENLNEI